MLPLHSNTRVTTSFYKLALTLLATGLACLDITATLPLTETSISPVSFFNSNLSLFRRQTPSSACAARETECGFMGNSDAYGLGIRLGIYLQWLASIIAAAFLPSEGASLADAYLVFSAALTISLYVLIFSNDCTFAVEVIILLYLLFGGLIISVSSFVGRST
jgi:hypothetical protein